MGNKAQGDKQKVPATTISEGICLIACVYMFVFFLS